MAATFQFSGPIPPEGEKWCTICARFYKGAFMQLESTQKLVSEGNAKPLTEIVRVQMRFPPKAFEPPLNLAVTTAMVVLPVIFEASPGQAQAQPMAQQADLCWSHSQGLFVGEGGRVQPYGPGDLPQERGAVMLGQSRGG